ncbi:MAG: PilT/PilU family type 4a pilus ATPase [Planctomycetota bacterium]
MANKIDKLFDQLKNQKGSDLHLLSGYPAKIRVHGELHPLTDNLSEKQVKEYLYEILDERQRERIDSHLDLDFAYDCPFVARFRANYMWQHFGIGAVFRIIPTKILTMADLSLGENIARFTAFRSGLLLVTGPTGSGKSTTLASIINQINETQPKHIVTIEEPVEFVHQNKKSFIVHREVGHDCLSFGQGLRSTSRQDPDVLLIGEMRDIETIGSAISAAEMGVVVFGTLHTNSAAKTVDRIIDTFPDEQQAQVRTQLSEALKGVISQLLLKTADRKGRVAAHEVLFSSSALANLIREGGTSKITSYIQGGKGDGMQLMDDAIRIHLKAGKIDGEEAYMKCFSKREFEQFLPPELKAQLAQV